MKKLDSPDGVLRIARAYVESQALFLALSAGIFELVGAKPCSIRFVLQKLHLHPHRGRSLIDWLLAQRFLSQDQRNKLTLTDLSRRFLLSSSPESVRQFVLWKAHAEVSWVRNADRALSGRVKTVYGPHCYDYMGKTGVSQLFQSGLYSIERETYDEVTQLLPRSIASDRALLAVDLGCGAGGLSLSFLSAFPNSKCICADINVAAVRKSVRSHSLQSRATVCQLDFTKDRIPNCDIVFLCMVLSDWPDQTVRAVLDKCYRALPPEGLLVIVEYVQDMAQDRQAMRQMAFLLSMETEGYLRCQPAWGTLLRKFSRIQFRPLTQNLTAIVATR